MAIWGMSAEDLASLFTPVMRHQCERPDSDSSRMDSQLCGPMGATVRKNGWEDLLASER